MRLSLDSPDGGTQALGAAWDLYVAGDVERSMAALSRITGRPLNTLVQTGTGRSRSVLPLAKCLRSYRHPNLLGVTPAVREEFGLALAQTSLYWLFLVDLTGESGGRTRGVDLFQLRQLVPFAVIIGSRYSFALDPEEMRKQSAGIQGATHDLPIGRETLDPPVPYDKHPEVFPELASLRELSRGARLAFIRTVQYTDIRSGLAEHARVNPFDLSVLTDGMRELCEAGILNTQASRSELLMDLSLRELKQLAFDEGVRSGGPKHRLVEALVAQLGPDRLDGLLRSSGRTGKFVHLLVSNLPLLKKYVWTEYERLGQYRLWVERVHCLRLRPQRATKEEEETWDGPDPMEPNPIDPGLKTPERARDFLAVPQRRAMIERVRMVWDSRCDQIVRDLAAEYGWFVHTSTLVSTAIEAYLGPDSVSALQQVFEADGLGVWRFALVWYGSVRVHEMGCPLRRPRELGCMGCGTQMMEWSVSARVAERVGYKILFCNECYSVVCWHGTRAEQTPTTEPEMLRQLADLAQALQAVPTQGFMETPQLTGWTDQQLVTIVRALLAMPSHHAYKQQFGTWLNALVLSGVLADGTMQTARGIRCVAVDGHECHSLAERTIDDWLTAHDVALEREPLYPYHPRLNPSGMRADWLVGATFIEYAGMMEEPDYVAKMETKSQLAAESRIPLIVIGPQDLMDLDARLGCFVESAYEGE